MLSKIDSNSSVVLRIMTCRSCSKYQVHPGLSSSKYPSLPASKYIDIPWLSNYHQLWSITSYPSSNHLWSPPLSALRSQSPPEYPAQVQCEQPRACVWILVRSQDSTSPTLASRKRWEVVPVQYISDHQWPSSMPAILGIHCVKCLHIVDMCTLHYMCVSIFQTNMSFIHERAWMI